MPAYALSIMPGLHSPVHRKPNYGLHAVVVCTPVVHPFRPIFIRNKNKTLEKKRKAEEIKWVPCHA